ncbi:hypothetical protein, partial [Methylobacterium sp. WL103]|uniref:hypothetical protein n=1 Tax=Methylobacterium sp. WL103 TaxID=2603891 RepID=UPI001AEEA091
SAGDKNHSPGYLKSYVSNLLSKELNKKSALSESPTLTQYVDAPNTADVRAPVKKKRQFGAFAGKFKVSSEFFEPMSQDELKSWGHE